MSSDTSMLHACASVVQCSGKPEAKRLSDWLWNYADSLADRLETVPDEENHIGVTACPQVDSGAQHNDAPGVFLAVDSTGASDHTTTAKES